ncbi:MAG: ATP-binding protein, partial [Hadesarchaea archaeon]
MYFGDRPKVRTEDFYDREDELRKLVDSLRKGSALTVVKGLRRLGKSSLMLIGLSKLGSPHLLIDCRQFEEGAHLP